MKIKTFNELYGGSETEMETSDWPNTNVEDSTRSEKFTVEIISSSRSKLVECLENSDCIESYKIL